jgi:hypothetical protein
LLSSGDDVKVTVHRRRDRREAGKATGIVRCTIRLPLLDFEIDRRFYLRSKRSLTAVAKFVRQYLPKAESALEGGSFSVFAEIRGKGLGVRWKRIGKWEAGEDAGLVLRRTTGVWEMLPQEKFERDDAEMDLADAVKTLRTAKK